MLLQIHDELILEVKDKRIKEFTDESKNIMENIVEFLVPLEVHANIGHSLSELK
jgi:DNA polymerase-1